MKKTFSMKYNRDFKRLYAKGNSVCGGYVVMYYRKAKVPYNVLGITVTKKLGKAVVRNRVKRLIRESSRLREDLINSGYYIVFVARNKSVDATFEKISHDMSFLLKKSGLISPSEE